MAENINENLDNENKELNQEEENKEKDIFTKEEVLKLLQSETDRRVTQALQKQQKKFDKQLSLSQLDGDAREKAEKDNRIAELEEQLKEFTLLQNKQEVIKVLTERNLNAKFADLVEIGEDVEEAQKKIEELDKLFKSAVADEVKRRLAGKTPTDSNKSIESMTKEEFQKLSLSQQAALYRDNPELYKQLTK